MSGELKVGATLMVTDEVLLHLVDLGAAPDDLDYGDTLDVRAIDTRRKFPVQVGIPGDSEWSAWIFLTIAERAHDFYKRQQELLAHGEGMTCPLPLGYWYAPYRAMTPRERNDFYQRYAAGDPDVLWQVAVYQQRRDSR